MLQLLISFEMLALLRMLCDYQACRRAAVAYVQKHRAFTVSLTLTAGLALSNQFCMSVRKPTERNTKRCCDSEIARFTGER